MLRRHIQTFYQNMMGSEFQVTPRPDNSPAPPPYFNPNKIPKRMTKHNKMEANWRLLEDRDDPPGAMKDLQKGTRKESKDRRPSKETRGGQSPSPAASNSKSSPFSNSKSPDGKRNSATVP